MPNRAIAIIDSGAGAEKYRIARALTEKNIYCEIFKEGTADSVIAAMDPAGILKLNAGAQPDLNAFVEKQCGLMPSGSFSDFTKAALAALKGRLAGKKILCALSGGVDSAVAAAMIHAVNPNGLTCVFVDHGLLRKGEAEEVMRVFGTERGMRVVKVDAEARYLKKLKGVSDPEQKRKIIGGEFIRIFEEEAKKIGKVSFLAQGTIYPDILESIDGIKAHHNVGGLPSVVDFDELCEPLQFLFKNEVRALGLELGLPESIVMRQPFPGPGLGVRVLGEITKEKLDILRDADYVYREEIAAANLDKTIWQYFVALPEFRSVGITNGKRTYGYTAILRGVLTTDAMTATVAPIPFEVLERISNRITTQVPAINRVVYDITSKPPATIEWE